MSSAPDSATPSLATLKDVARLAGVAPTTASDALHGKGRVSEATRTRVAQAAAALRYRPHAGARDLNRRRTEVIGLLVGDLFDPFVAELTAHLEAHASSSGLRALLATTGPDLRAEERALSNLMEHRVAALILVAYGGDDAHLRSIVGPTPVVSIGSSAAGTSIGIDDVTGALLAVEHLLELGHTRIAYLGGEFVGRFTNSARLSGYRAALRRAGVAYAEDYVCEVGLRSDADRMKPVKELLSSAHRPTAIFAASDVLAIELMTCAHALGLAVPRDLSIVGFDDMLFAKIPAISLTTVAQAAERLARLCVEAITEHLTAGTALQPQVIEPVLVVRGSTAEPPDETSH